MDALLVLGQVNRAIRDADFRRSGLRADALPAPVAEALRILDDGDFRAVSAALHPPGARRPAPAEARVARRDLLRGLRTRYPSAMTAIRAARAPASIVTAPYFFIHMVTGACQDLTFEEGDPRP